MTDGKKVTRCGLGSGGIRWAGFYSDSDPALAQGIAVLEDLEDAPLVEDVEEVPVDLAGAAHLGEDGDGALVGGGDAVRAIAGAEGVIDVADGHHARLDRDLAGAERVPAAVHL